VPIPGRRRKWRSTDE